jgi:DNA-binding transcriptional MerR regulator
MTIRVKNKEKLVFEKVQKYIDAAERIQESDRLILEVEAVAELWCSVQTLRVWAKRMRIFPCSPFGVRFYFVHDVQRIKLRRKYHRYIKLFDKYCAKGLYKKQGVSIFDAKPKKQTIETENNMKNKNLELRERLFYTLQQAEELTGIPTNKLRGYINQGTLQADMIGGRVNINGKDLINLKIEK